MELKAQEISARANISCYFEEHKTDGNMGANSNPKLLSAQEYFVWSKGRRKKTFLKHNILFRQNGCV